MDAPEGFDTAADLGNLQTRLARRIPLLKPLRVALPDLLAALRFRQYGSRRSAGMHDLRRCRSPEQLLRFANETFGTGQIADEILAFLEFAAGSAPQRVCEIGTATGGTTFLLGQALPECSRLIGVDLYVRNRHLLRQFSRPGLGLCFVSGSSRAPRTIERVRRLAGDRGLDLLFIDGDHSYEGVRRDFADYAPLVREGGIVALHDICGGAGSKPPPGSNVWVGGVPRLWSELRRVYEHREFVRSPEQFGFGIGALRYDPAVDVPR